MCSPIRDNISSSKGSPSDSGVGEARHGVQGVPASARWVGHAMALLSSLPRTACLPRKRRCTLKALPEQGLFSSVWRACFPRKRRQGRIPNRATNYLCKLALARARARLRFQASRPRFLPHPSRTRSDLPAAAFLTRRNSLALCQILPRAMVAPAPTLQLKSTKSEVA